MFTLGDTTITRVEEQLGAGYLPEFLFPDWDPAVLDEHRWMIPDCFDIEQGRFIASIHSWVVRTPHHTILIDTCSGNDKERPLLERFHRRSHPYLARLAAAGVRPEEVDYVLCTHLHADHCGWNTQLLDGRWVPTFPNARYVFSRAERDFWDGPGSREGFNENVFEDSVQPILEAGLEQLIDGEGQLGDNLHFKSTPGHSVGHLAIRLLAAEREALFSGDIMHQPIQVYRPEWNSRFCEDAEEARRSRRWVLEHCEDTGALLLPAHFAGSFAGHVSRRGDGFAWQFM